jgi:hypothetical protein
MDFVIVWDLLNDVEVNSFDTKHNALTFQDSKGNLFIAEEDSIINCNTSCRVMSYKVNVNDFDSENLSFGFDKGCRV